MLRLLLSTLVLSGCADIKADIDSDIDGLLNSQEDTLGTDPNNDDSDGDGHTDGAEYQAGFDPLDPESHPYFGDYPTKPCDPQPASTGYAVGDISPDFELVDQHGEMVSLSDFCDKTVVIETSAFW